jgi:hypothetical protein
MPSIINIIVLVVIRQIVLLAQNHRDLLLRYVYSTGDYFESFSVSHGNRHKVMWDSQLTEWQAQWAISFEEKLLGCRDSLSYTLTSLGRCESKVPGA